MTDLDRSFDENVYDLNAILHPGSVFDHPRDVLADTALSRAEKRAILASWASDAAAVASCPSMRAVPGAKRAVSIGEILEERELDLRTEPVEDQVVRLGDDQLAGHEGFALAPEN